MAEGDTYELSVVGRCLGQEIVNVFHFRAMAAGNLASAIAADFNTNMKTSFLANLPAAYQLQTLKCQQINPVGPIGIDYAPTGTTVGALATNPSTLAATAVIGWTTAYVGRSRRGRTFYGPMAGDQYTSDSLIAGRVTGITTFVTTFMGRYLSGGTFAATAQAVVWSPTIAGQYSQATPPAMGDPTSASAYILNAVVRTLIHTQRRRATGVGS
jgi:hypothetical protein